MRILLAYPGHGFSTIDVASGYAKGLRDLGHEVFEFNYHLKLAFFQEGLRRWAKLFPDDFSRTEDDWVILASEALFIEVFDVVPDVVIIICGLALHRRVYDMIEKLGIPKVLILTESPYADDDQSLIIEKGSIAAAFTNDRASVKKLRKDTGVRVEYLPHSWNPGTHFERGMPDGKYLSDVFFFGTLWPERKELFSGLGTFEKDGPNIERLHSNNGIAVNVAGVEPIRNGKVEGFIHNAEMAWYYAGTKIAINHNRTVMGEDEDGKPLHVKRGQAWSLGPRAFEISACGTFQLSDGKRPELKKVFGRTVPTYKDSKDLAAKVRYYLDRPDERLDMSIQASKKIQYCRFEDRAREILIPTIMEVI